MPLNRIFLFLLPIGFLLSCSTKKNTFVSRGYHNLTARYNGYYYSNEAISDGIYKIEKANKENFDRVLPVFIYPGADKAKSTFAEFDRAIKKSSLCIQKHAIKDGNGAEVPSAGRWIDNNWINIGVAHFYKREYFNGIESFEYVIRTYNKSKDKFDAMLWLIKSNNEIGSITASDPFLSLLKNEKNLPLHIKKELPAVEADYYLRRGQTSEAIARLMEATRNSTPLLGLPRKDRARYCFIIAQLLEQQKNYSRAMLYYRKTIALKPASYDMMFYSKIRVARLMDTKGHSQKVKKDLLKMSREFKNTDYYDVIFYTLGELEEKDKNVPQALNYYKKSVQTSISNPNQKASSYLKLGEINFDLTNYEPAEAYYDSAVVTLPKDHPDYERILARKKTLEELVGYIRTISREDSLQRIARMSTADRERFVDNLIVRLKEEEEKKQRELEAAKNAATNNGAPGTLPTLPGGMGGQSTSFYFYNPNTVALGISDFTKKWGNRKLEDNWRRSNKALSVEDPDGGNKVDSLNPAKNTKLSTVKSREFYMKDLPLNDSALTTSSNKMIKAYYMMGSIYKEELQNSKKTITSFEELNKRFPGNKYQLNTYYMLYRMYLAEKNEPKAEFYKNKLINEFPDSEFTLLIKNPSYAETISTQKSEAEKFYSETYVAYSAKNYNSSYKLASEGIAKYGKNDYLPKFEFIKAMSLGNLKGADSLEYALKLLVAKHPNSDITPLSNEILLSIKKQKNPELFKTLEVSKLDTDTFSVNLDSEHFVVLFTPDDSKKTGDLKTNIGSFNGVYYGDKKFEINSNLFGKTNQMILVKTFANAKDAINYCDNLLADPDVFKGELKKEEVSIYPILAANMPLLYKTKNLEAYKAFYETKYKKNSSGN
ncbi:MAG: tetratricopeptide repeat protein [Bacteroidia bacterium]|nr:tetratricopeptide repeat protein [Bacteroidia bacterium]